MQDYRWIVCTLRPEGPEASEYPGHGRSFLSEQVATDYMESCFRRHLAQYQGLWRVTFNDHRVEEAILLSELEY